MLASSMSARRDLIGPPEDFAAEHNDANRAEAQSGCGC
jgi:hypothetical protein